MNPGSFLSVKSIDLFFLLFDEVTSEANLYQELLSKRYKKMTFQVHIFIREQRVACWTNVVLINH